MRYLLAAAFWFWPVFACSEELPSDAVQIGAFTMERDGSFIELGSFISEDQDFSDLSVSNNFGTKTYHLFGWANGELPFLDIALQEGRVAGELSITNVTLIDQNEDDALAATRSARNGVAFESYGVIGNDAINISDTGEVSFTFSIDLVRINLETGDLLHDRPGSSIAGSFTGQIPASELNE